MQPRGEEAAESSDDSDDGEEAARILRKIRFPEVGKKPQDVCMAITTCLQARVGKLQPISDKLCEQDVLSVGHEKNPAESTSYLLLGV